MQNRMLLWTALMAVAGVCLESMIGSGTVSAMLTTDAAPQVLAAARPMAAEPAAGASALGAVPDVAMLLAVGAALFGAASQVRQRA